MIYLVSTKLGTGKGGISTAVKGLSEEPVLQKSKLEIVTSHNAKSRIASLSAFCYLAKNAKRKDIIWLHCGMWFSMLRKFLLSIVPKFKGAKIVFHLHSQTIDTALNHWFSSLMIYSVLKWADGVIVLTPWWKNRLLVKFPWLTNKIFVSPNSIDRQLMAATSHKKTRVHENEVRLLAMTRLTSGKGVEIAIHTMLELPDNYTLSVAGEGELLADLKELASQLGLSKRVSFLGWVNYEEKPQVFADHDIFFLPSKYDSFGMGYIEAMSHGLPVVALNFQAIPDVVPNNRAGILCATNEPKVLSEAIINCTQSIEDMGDCGQKHVISNFDPRLVSKRLVDFFEGLRV